MKELAQCLRTPSPFRCDSKYLTSRQIITGWEFHTSGKYTITFLIGNKLSQLTIFLWFGEMIGCSRLQWSWIEGLASTRFWSTVAASSTSRSNSARVEASFCSPLVWASSSSCFIRAREDLEARVNTDNRRITREITVGMTTGNEI